MTALFNLVLWSWLMASSFIVSANVSAYASPLAMSLFRFGAAFLLMLPFVYGNLRKQCTQENQPFLLRKQFRTVFVSRAVALQYVVISGTLVGFFICLFAALHTTTPLNTSVLYSFIPLLGALFSWLWLKAKTPAPQLFGFALGSTAAITVLFSNHSGAFHWHVGDLIYFIGCLLLALHVIAVQKWGKAVPPMHGAFMIMTFGTLWLLPLAFCFGDLEQVQWAAPGFWLNALYLTIFTTFLTFLLQQHLVVTIGAKMVLAFTYTIPVWVAMYTALQQHQLQIVLRPAFIAGVLCLLVSLFMISGVLNISIKWHGLRKTADEF